MGCPNLPKAYVYDILGRMSQLHTFKADPGFGTNPLAVTSIPAGGVKKVTHTNGTDLSSFSVF